MLARSAAFNAGYAFVTSYKAVDENGDSDRILKLLGEWEKARMAGVFTKEQRKLMKDLNNEFRLETVTADQWKWFRIYSYKFKHEKKERQPGEPLYSKFDFRNEAQAQPLKFIFTAVNGGVNRIGMEIDNYKKIDLPLTLDAGQTIKYAGGNAASVYSRNWNLLRRIPVNQADLTVGHGEHSLIIDSPFGRGEKPYIKLELRISSEPKILKIKK
jgi:hypothetical protein